MNDDLKTSTAHNSVCILLLSGEHVMGTMDWGNDIPRPNDVVAKWTDVVGATGEGDIVLCRDGSRWRGGVCHAQGQPTGVVQGRIVAGRMLTR